MLFICRWELPSAGNYASRSTANELRRDKDVHVDPDKLKAVSEGFFLSRFFGLF